MEYYKYETKHKCPCCNNLSLHFEGSVSNTEMFSCFKCNAYIGVDFKYKISSNMNNLLTPEFDGFSEPKIL